MDPVINLNPINGRVQRFSHPNLIIWKEEKIVSRKKNMIRLLNVSQVYCLEGDSKVEVKKLKEIYK